MISARQKVLVDTHSMRQQAADLLRALESAQAECEEQLAKEQRVDAMKQVTGRSSLEHAVADTRRMIEALDRAMDEARRSVPDAAAIVA
jgi:hypothetical protein